VISDGNYHNIIGEGHVTRVEVIEETLMHYKIDMKYKYSPLNIKFKYNKKVNLKVFISTTNKMPNERDCENEYIKPSRISIWAPGRSKEFTKDFVYLTLLSTSHIPVDIMIKFNTIERALGSKKLKHIEAATGQDGKPVTTKLLTEEQQKLLAKMTDDANINRVITGNDIVKRNIKIAFQWREISQQKIESGKEDHDRKLFDVKNNNK
jgi:hypothetical protein